MDYLFRGDSEVAAPDTAVLMTNGKASAAIARTDETEKTGGGEVRVTGPYTGAADATIDVRIADEDIDGTPSASAPVFVGVGNATITTPTGAAGMGAETWTLTVENLGTETRFAEAQFQGAVLRATTPGARSIRIEITPDLVFEGIDCALREPIPQDAELLDGQFWNFGALALTADGDIPSYAPRLQFGIDPQVFRQFMRWDDSKARYVYGLSPRPPRAIPAGALVRRVTGTYSMRIIEGDVVEPYDGLVTLYDALDAMRSRSALVKPFTAVVADHRPGGMAAVDLSVLTSSYCASIDADGGEGVQRGEILLVVGPNAPTENLSIEFVDAETAEIRGEVSGLIGRARVGGRFESEHYAFRIPVPPTDPTSTGVQMIVILRLAARDANAPAPALCDYLTRPGINLRNGATKWVFGPNPPPPCDCTGLSADNPPPSDDCLGIEYEETTVSEESRVLRMQRVATWLREFIAQNTYLYDGFANDIAIVRRGASILLECLDSIAGAKLENPAWEASKLYKVDQVIEPPTPTGYRYAITIGGTSHTSAPTFPTTVGDTVTDGNGVTYENIGKKPLAMWDDAFRQLRLDTASLFATHATAGGSAQVWQPNIDITGEIALLPTTDAGHYYVYESGSWPTNTGDTEPTWVTDGGTVTVGGLTYRDAGLYGGVQRSTPYALDVVVHSPYHGTLLCIDDGTTAATMPGYAGLAVNDTFADGGVTWKITSRSAGSADGNAAAPATDAFWTRHEAIANDVRAAAGVKGNFSQSGDKERCWTEVKDAPGAFWYAGSDEPGYMQVWPNHWNVLAEMGPEGVASTREGAFLPLISCAENLIAGDELTLVVKGVTGTGSGWYQQGDKWVCQITAAGPVELGGGQAGDDTTMISVLGTASGRLRDYLVYRPAPAPYDGGADAWDTDDEYVAGDFVRPTSANGLRYRAEGSGGPGAIEPTWPTDVGDAVVDGDITWRCVGPDTLLGLTIAEGGIRLALGDQWTFAFEGGHFEWRLNGGAWSDPVAIAPTVALTAGLTAAFVGGTTPSWRTGDVFSFTALAVAGVDNLRRPTGRSAHWIGSTTIEFVPPASTATRLAIIGHTIPPSATITFQGSDDDWSTTPLNVNVPWSTRDLHVAIPVPRAKYRILVNSGGSIFWVFLGRPFRPTIAKGPAELGRWTPERRPSTPARAGGVGGRIEHTWLPQAVVDALLDHIDVACNDDQRRFAVIPNAAESGVHFVALAAGTVPVTDEQGYAPRDPVHRRLSLELQLEPAA